MRVFNPYAPLNRTLQTAACYQRHECEKRRKYEERICGVEHASFVPLVLSCTSARSRSLCDHLFPKAGSLASREAPLHLQHGGVASLPPQFCPLAISYRMPQECMVNLSPPRPNRHECRGPCNVRGSGGTQLTIDLLKIHHLVTCYFFTFISIYSV